MKHNELKIELIQWDDAQSIDNWEDMDQISSTTCPNIYSIGFVLKETKDIVTLALNIDEANEKASCVMLIPKKMIVKRTKINAKTHKSRSNTAR